MDKLNRDEIFLIATRLDIKNLIKLSSCNKYLRQNVMTDEVWYYKLKEFSDYQGLKKETPFETYKFLYGLNILKIKLRNQVRFSYTMETLVL